MQQRAAAVQRNAATAPLEEVAAQGRMAVTRTEHDEKARMKGPVSQRLENFSVRYAIEHFPDGTGVLVDLQTGSYYQLNGSAVAVCTSLATTATPDEAIPKISRDLAISESAATAAMLVVGTGLASGKIPQSPVGPLCYLAGADRSAVFEENGKPIFSVEFQRSQVRLRALPSELSGPVALYLQALVPKLLALLELPVLHASACQINGELRTFSGLSGAGKTTTARAFQSSGGRLLSEDLVVLTFPDGTPAMYEDAESIARTWARKVGTALEEEPDSPIDFAELRDVQQGPLLPLDSMWFVDVSRRRGVDLTLRRLTAREGVVSLLRDGMLASHQSDDWRKFLRRSRTIADRIRLSEATVPDGIERLEMAARIYSVKVTA